MTDTLYALYPVFRADPEVRSAFADPEDRARATREVEDLVKRLGDRVTLRGSYSTVGFRADADLCCGSSGLPRKTCSMRSSSSVGPRSARTSS